MFAQSHRRGLDSVSDLPPRAQPPTPPTMLTRGRPRAGQTATLGDEPTPFTASRAADASSLVGWSDDALVRAMTTRAGQAALAALYDRHAALLLALATKILARFAGRDAEDLLHDVFLEVWRQGTSYDAARGSVRGWLLMRMRSRALDRLRALRRGHGVGLEDVGADAPDPRTVDPGLAVDGGAVQRAVAALPAAQRAVLELAYFGGLSSSEMATALGVPLGTVKSRVAAALGALRARFEDLAPGPAPRAQVQR